MSRFLLLIVFLIWMAWRSDGKPPAMPPARSLALFIGVFLLLVGMLGAWSRLLARRVAQVRLDRALRYFNRVSLSARLFVPVWFFVGVFFLGWGDAVQRLLGPVSRWPVQLPGAIVGTMPALLAWVGLWWAQFPADHALRERHMLIRFDEGEPIYRPPGLWSYLVANFRLQVLFAAVPILLILAVHDVIWILVRRGFEIDIEQSPAGGFVNFGCAVAVFLVVPEILVRVLPTQPLPPSPLRDRMEAMSKAHRLKFRDILLWRTEYRIANALVMGIIPRFRYVLLSDLLLAEMEDEQIEAVFAHEVGHVVHRHLVWYMVLLIAAAVVGLILEAGQHRLQFPSWLPVDLVTSLIGLGAFLIAFGFVSRRCERQADVFAARTLEAAPGPSHVGPLGATVFSSALQRVALINNMPIEPRGRWEGGLVRRVGWVLERIGDAMNNWLHGSIATRMRTLHRMSADPVHTHHFDKRMARLYVALIVLLFVSGALAWFVK